VSKKSLASWLPPFFVRSAGLATWKVLQSGQKSRVDVGSDSLEEPTNDGDEGVTTTKGDEGAMRAATIGGDKEGATSDGDEGATVVE
jgi:hypothetical protein